jgi:hypothetical protein
MPRWERRTEQLPAPPPGYHLYSRLWTGAAGTYNGLNEAWKRPKRHNRRVERAALWYALELGENCAEVAATPEAWSLLRDLSPEADVEERYEVQAAVHAIRHNLPFTPQEREALNETRSVRSDFLFESDRIGAREPALVEEWHRWVWANERQRPRTRKEALGASAILAEGCSRLTQSLRGFLDF